MAYYTDEDRRKAAARRKLKQQFKQLRESPEDTYDILGISVPYVPNKPSLDEFGLAEDIEEILSDIDKQSISEKKFTRQVIFWCVLAVLTFVILIYAGIWGTLVVLLFGSIYIYAFYAAVTDVEPTRTHLHESYEDYNLQKSYYDYWQRRKDKNHWNKMTGHGFEQAVANLFRNAGFNSEVSNRGGDGGVDIVIQRADRRIAVQCKRYNKPVGPHVIRDLLGTMHYLGYSEGCIVTTTGFTKGVKDFANGKPIYLIDLNDILKMTNDSGNIYLLQKLGELI